MSMVPTHLSTAEPVTYQQEGQPIQPLRYSSSHAPAVSTHSQPYPNNVVHPWFARYRFPVERLGRAIALLLGARLLTMSLGWVLLKGVVSASLMCVVVLMGGGVALFAYWSMTPYPVARLKTPSVRFYGVVGGVGLLLGLL